MDLDIENESGYLNVEVRIDKGIGIYIEAKNKTLMLTKEETLKLAKWLVEVINQ